MIFLVILSLLLGMPSAVFAASSYSLDPQASHVTFDGDSTLHGFHGKAKEIAAENVSFDFSTAMMNSPRKVRIPIAALDTGNSRRDAAMRKMFDTGHFPEMIWDAASMDCTALSEPGWWTCEQSGTLTIRDISQTYILKLTLTEDDSDNLEADGDLDVSLADFKLKPPSVLGVIKVGDKVRIHVRTRWKPT